MALLHRHGERRRRVDIVRGNFLELWNVLDCGRLFIFISEETVNILEISNQILNICHIYSLQMMISTVILLIMRNLEISFCGNLFVDKTCPWKDINFFHVCKYNLKNVDILKNEEDLRLRQPRKLRQTKKIIQPQK